MDRKEADSIAEDEEDQDQIESEANNDGSSSRDARNKGQNNRKAGRGKAKGSESVPGKSSIKNTITQGSVDQDNLQSMNTLSKTRTASGSKKKEGGAIYRFINSKGYIIFSALVTTLNLIFLAANNFQASEAASASLRILNILCTVYFAFENVMRLIGYGIKNFLRDMINLFDFAIVLTSIVLITIDAAKGVPDPARGTITALRMVRIIRVFKFSEQFKGFRSLVRTLSRTIVDLRDFMMLLLIFMVIFALLGRELYAYKVRFLPDGKATKDYAVGTSNRLNFDSFADAMVTVFVIITSDGWNFLMYDHVRTSSGLTAIVFFFSIQLFGNFMLVKLFIGMVINNFSVTTQREKEEEALLEADPFGRMIAGVEGIGGQLKRLCCFKRKQNKLPTTSSGLELAAIENGGKSAPEQITEAAAIKDKDGNKKGIKTGILANLITKTKMSNAFGNKDGAEDNRRLSFIETVPHPAGEDHPEMKKEEQYAGIYIHADNIKDHNDPLDSEQDDDVVKHLDPSKAKKNKKQKFEVTGKSLNWFDSTSNFRMSCVNLVRHKKFDSFVAIFIVISSINLALDRPMMDPASRERVIIRMIDLSLTLAFSCECSIKIIAYGFMFNGKQSYLRSLVNCLDFFVVIAGLLSFDDTFSESLDALRILRITRVLRPLRLIARSEGLKVVINSIVASLPSLLRLVIVNTTFLFVFAAILMNYKKGKFYFCEKTNIELQFQDLILTKSDCLDYGGDWLNDDVNFDSIFMSMASLFQTATLDDWSDIMLKSVDAVGVDIVPQKNYEPNWKLFFVAFVVLGSFLIISTFAGVIVDVFNREKDKAGGMSLVTREQGDWIRVQLSVLKLKPKVKPIPHTNAILIKMTKLVTSPKYELFMNSLVVCNLVLFTLYWNRMSPVLKEVLKYVGYIFLTAFTTEASMKMIVLRRAYFKDNWNLFSLTILCITLSSTVLTALKIVNFGKSTAGIRSLRVFRLLRMIRKAKNLRIIFTILITTLPAILNIGAFLLLFMFVYSILGMNLFGYIRLQDGISSKANFSSFGLSFITLLRASTGEDWSRLMKDGARRFGPNFVCYNVGSYEEYLQYGQMNCGTNYAYVYFITYQLVLSMILINLFMAVIIKTFEETSKAESFLIPSHNFTQFVDSWKKIDGDATAFIPTKTIEDFFLSLEQPMGWKGKKNLTRAKKSHFVSSLELPIYQFEEGIEKYYYFYDVALAVARKTVSENYFTDDLDPPFKIESLKQVEVLRAQRFKAAVQSRAVIMLSFTSSHHTAVKVLERYCRAWRARKLGLQPEDLDDVPRIQTETPVQAMPRRKSSVSSKKYENAGSVNEQLARTSTGHSRLSDKSGKRPSVKIVQDFANGESTAVKRLSSEMSQDGIAQHTEDRLKGNYGQYATNEPYTTEQTGYGKRDSNLDTSVNRTLNDSSNFLMRPEKENPCVDKLNAIPSSKVDYPSTQTLLSEDNGFPRTEVPISQTANKRPSQFASEYSSPSSDNSYNQSPSLPRQTSNSPPAYQLDNSGSHTTSPDTDNPRQPLQFNQDSPPFTFENRLGNVLPQGLSPQSQRREPQPQPQNYQPQPQPQPQPQFNSHKPQPQTNPYESLPEQTSPNNNPVLEYKAPDYLQHPNATNESESSPTYQRRKPRLSSETEIPRTDRKDSQLSNPSWTAEKSPKFQLYPQKSKDFQLNLVPTALADMAEKTIPIPLENIRANPHDTRFNERSPPAQERIRQKPPSNFHEALNPYNFPPNNDTGREDTRSNRFNKNPSDKHKTIDPSALRNYGSDSPQRDSPSDDGQPSIHNLLQNVGQPRKIAPRNNYFPTSQHPDLLGNPLRSARQDAGSLFKTPS